MIDFRLCLVTDRRLCDSLESATDVACRSGVRAIQLREKDLDSRRLFALTREIRRITSTHGAKLIINDRVDIAMALRADGVHCPQEGFPPAVAREILGPGALIGASCHSLESAIAAADANVDFLFYGPVFATPSKAAFGPPVSMEALKAVCAQVEIPVFAIGGVTPERSALCVENGASGVAVISAVLAGDDIASAIEAFQEALGGL
ncbi:MAG: thiamine phosphate synthase [Candidatus Krumholzibacteria bacterium]|nr:thiamine phosphate synthase [Candidatus Krumholzibacteria bacterium]